VDDALSDEGLAQKIIITFYVSGHSLQAGEDLEASQNSDSN